MFNKKLIMLTIIISCVLAVSAVSAEDNATNDAVSLEETTDEIGIVEDQAIEKMYDEEIIGKMLEHSQNFKKR